MSGMYFMRAVELLGLFVIIKAIYETFKNHKNTLNGGVYGSILHSNQHVAALLGIIFYNTYDLWSFVWFETETYDEFDYTVLFFNLLFLNLLWLVLIDHFKQERLGRTTKSNLFDLFKF